MKTIQKTSKAAIARKLNSLGFEARDGWSDVGYQISLIGTQLIVWNTVYVQHPSTAAEELAAAGYVVHNVRIQDLGYTRETEFFEVLGRMSA
jgi:hypothetical protein